MTPSKLKHIASESKQVVELLRSETGSFAYFIPEKGPNGSYKESIAHFSRQVKSRATQMNARCKIETFLLITNGDVPEVQKIVRVEKR